MVMDRHLRLNPCGLPGKWSVRCSPQRRGRVEEEGRGKGVTGKGRGKLGD